ncbi:MAG TPA: transposase [Thermoanaerobaculia bacterium]|nr:transposase [Thermoanaerobaculia bacterium]
MGEPSATEGSEPVTAAAGKFAGTTILEDERGTGLALLRDEELLSEQRIELLLSWQDTGFSVHNSVTVGPEDAAGSEQLARYLLRPPLSLERMSWDAEGSVLYRRKAPGPFGGSQATFDAMDFLARLLMHTPPAQAAHGALLRRVLERRSCPWIP